MSSSKHYCQQVGVAVKKRGIFPVVAVTAAGFGLYSFFKKKPAAPESSTKEKLFRGTGVDLR